MYVQSTIGLPRSELSSAVTQIACTVIGHYRNRILSRYPQGCRKSVLHVHSTVMFLHKYDSFCLLPTYCYSSTALVCHVLHQSSRARETGKSILQKHRARHARRGSVTHSLRHRTTISAKELKRQQSSLNVAIGNGCATGFVAHRRMERAMMIG